MPENVFAVAESIRTPLALAGLVVVVLFLLYRQMVSAGKGSVRWTSPLIRHVITLLFWLAMTAIVLSAIAWVLPIILQPREFTLFGKVHLAGDRTTPVPDAIVTLDHSVTQRQEVDRDGNVAFRLPMTMQGSSAEVWANAPGYEPSRPERITIRYPMDRLVIALAQQTKQPPLTPVDPTRIRVNNLPFSPSVTALRTLTFHYPWEPDPGRRTWRLLGSGRWVEEYPDGRVTEFRAIGRTTIDDCGGEVVRAAGESMEVFIPDQGCRLDWFRFRVDARSQWAFLGLVDSKR